MTVLEIIYTIHGRCKDMRDAGHSVSTHSFLLKAPCFVNEDMAGKKLLLLSF